MKENLTLEKFITKLCLLLKQSSLFNELDSFNKRRFLKRYTFCLSSNNKNILIHFFDGTSSNYKFCASIQKEIAPDLFNTFSYSYLYLNEKRELFKIIDNSDYVEIDPINKTVYLTSNYWTD